MVQMMVLEVISPAVFISYLSPKDDNNAFSKWISIYISTYIDVFIRIAIINFAATLIILLFSGADSRVLGDNIAVPGAFAFWEHLNVSNVYTKYFYIVIMVLAILSFAKKAPELLKQLLPTNASGLSFSGAMKDITGLQGLLGFGLGAVTGTAGSFVGGGLSANVGHRAITVHTLLNPGLSLGSLCTRSIKTYRRRTGICDISIFVLRL